MKFLVVGASGVVGSATMEHLHAAGFETIGTQAAQSRADLIPFNLLHHRIADQVPRGFFESDARVYGVICACISQIDRCRRERELSWQVNVEKTIQLIDDLVRDGARPIFISTCYVFDGTVGYYDESHPRSPICEYGRQKVAVEEYLEDNVPQAAVLRLDRPVSDQPQVGSLFGEWWNCIQENRPIRCIAGQYFAPTLLSDCARAIALAAELDLQGIYHVANHEYFERAELARQFVRAMGVEANILSLPQEAFAFDDHRPLKSYPDSTKFVTHTGMRFTPVRQAFRQFKNNLG